MYFLMLPPDGVWVQESLVGDKQKTKFEIIVVLWHTVYNMNNKVLVQVQPV
jgi:hypothetical protein